MYIDYFRQGEGMKRILYGFFWVCTATILQASPYWLVEQDFIKLGKKDLYEKEKNLILKKEDKKVFGFSDLENSQYVFLMPLQKISSLEEYPPFNSRKDDVLLNTSLHFQIFSLHAWIEKASLRFDNLLTENRPYIFYGVYDVEVEATEAFENHIASRKESFPTASWGLWKSMLAGIYPKYIFCASFITKEELVRWSMDQVFSGLEIKDVLRSKQEGRLKQEKELSHQ